METTFYLKRFILSLTFSLVIMFPSVINYSYVHNNHSHNICKDKSTHFHKKINVCHLCDFYFPSNDLSFEYNSSLILEIGYSSSVPEYNSFFLNLKLNNKNSRGPPSSFES
jgi:hypothetical protein